MQELPVAISSKSGPGSALIQPTANGVRIRHREFVQTIESTINATIGQRSVQPGLTSTFQWLGVQAGCYETYRFRRLRIEYEPTCPSTTSGILAGCFDFDPTDAQPGNLRQLLSNEFKFQGAPWQRMSMELPTNRLSKATGGQLYVRQGDLSANQDAKLFDAGKFYWRTAGFAANDVIIGCLYMTYDIELITPQYNTAVAYRLAAKLVGSPAPSIAIPFGTLPIKTGQGEVTAVNDTITINEEGEWFIMVVVTGTVLAAAAWATPDPNEVTLNVGGSTINATGTSMVSTVQVTCSSQGRVTLSLATSASVSATVTRMFPWTFALG
jgi:hypothetical protein